MIIVAIGLGMFLSLLFTETIGLAAGGVVVPGYIALYLHHPAQVVSTVIVGLVTFVIVKILSHYILLYGRRLLITCIIIGYLLGYATKLFPPMTLSAQSIDIATIGFVVPGLIAYWIQRQGVIETITAMMMVSIVVRFIIIIMTKGAISP